MEDNKIEEQPANGEVQEQEEAKQNQENKGFSLVTIIVVNVLMIFLFKGVVSSIMTATRGPATVTKYKPSYRRRSPGSLSNLLQPNQEYDLRLSLYI